MRVPELQDNAIRAIVHVDGIMQTEDNVQKAAAEKVALKSVGVCRTEEGGKDILTQDVAPGRSHPSGVPVPGQQ